MVTDKKFTKGKWIIKASICFESVITTESGIRIAETKSFGDGFYDATEEEQKANAKLISAAPELLEALEILSSYCITSGHLDLIVEVPIIQNALLAIQKATE